MKFEKPKEKKEKVESPEQVEQIEDEGAIDEQLDAVIDRLVEMAITKEGGITEKEVGRLTIALRMMNQEMDEKARIAEKKLALDQWQKRTHSGEAKETE